MPRLIFYLITLCILCSCKEEAKPPIALNELITKPLEFNKRLEVITFGSCSKQNEKQPMWKSIADENPDLWIWSGDNIYGDSEDMSVLKKKYNEQLSHPAYQRFLERVPIVGTWDDHDYGVNDGGKEYPMKKQSRDLMFDFLAVPKDNPAWNREGAYQSYSFGSGTEKVKLILLDARYFRDKPRRTADRKAYIPDKGDILGEEQWAWLEQELMNDEVRLNIIVSGIQIIPEDHRFEKWANFPLARDRIFNLIRSSGMNTFLISGDRHIGEISSIDLQDQTVYEITSSGLTHSYESFTSEENQHRVSDVVSTLNYGKLSIDWDSDPITVTGEIKGLGKKSLEKIEFVLY